MRVTPTLLQDYFLPSECERRVQLRARGELEGEPDPFLKTLAFLGDQHEARQRAVLAPYLDLSQGNPDDRIQRTREALADPDVERIFRPLLLASTVLAGEEREVVGEPDFLVREGEGWSVLEIKLARSVDDKHKEIRQQIECYGWLLEETLGQPPVALKAILGDGEVHEIPREGPQSTFETLDRILTLRKSEITEYEPVGWSKCYPCGFRKICWGNARKKKDLALVPDLDQGLARALHRDGVKTIADLLANFDEKSLSEYRRARGDSVRKVGKIARRLLLGARAMETNQDIRIGVPDIPRVDSYAVFDIEGIPPDYRDDIGRIFLWGVRIFGENPSEFRFSSAGSGPDSDRIAWFEFLKIAREIFDRFGEGIPFVHWASYERTKIRSYLERHGDDPSGTGEQVLESLLDLLTCTKGAWALPLPSYSLKVIEQRAGYVRKLKDVDGAWAMAQYIEALEKGDEKLLQERMIQIRFYNEEDLAATWQVLVWLMKKEGWPVPGA